MDSWFSQYGCFELFGYGGIGMVVLVLLLVAFGVYLFVRNDREPRHRSVPISGEDYLDILKGRFAKGEISEEEYNRMKRDLDL